MSASAACLWTGLGIRSYVDGEWLLALGCVRCNAGAQASHPALSCALNERPLLLAGGLLALGLRDGHASPAHETRAAGRPPGLVPGSWPSRGGRLALGALLGERRLKVYANGRIEGEALLEAETIPAPRLPPDPARDTGLGTGRLIDAQAAAYALEGEGTLYRASVPLDPASV